MSILRRKLNPNNFIKQINQRGLWEFVNIAFNRVDTERLKLVGADRLCAEWILKNDGAVRFTSEPLQLIKKYNALPDEKQHFHIKEIDATNSCIMKIGFEHLKDCNYIDKIILHKCTHMENSALAELSHAKNTLKYLEISSCYNVNDSGLLALKELKNLKELVLHDLPFVKDLNKSVEEICKSLPNCCIETNKINV